MPDKDLLRFERLKLSHVRKMKDWKRHENPLLEDYNFDFYNEKGFKLFYFEKTMSPFDRYYAIIYDDKVIGYLGTKQINFLTRSSVLGLVLDPGIIDKGYGTLALSEFLKFYFDKLKMRKMILEVAAYNPRAKHVYEKMGFKEEGMYLDLYPNKKIFKYDPYYISYKDAFVIKDDIIYNYVYRMILEKKEFKFEVFA